MKNRIVGLVTGLIVSVFLVPVQASTISEEEFICPYDGIKFTAVLQASGSSWGKMLDFRPYGAIEAPWPIASCPTNGFVFLKSHYDEAELERLKPLVLSADYQALKQEATYYRAAWLKARTGAPSIEVFWTLLQATWQASGEPEKYRRYATELLQRLPPDIAQEADADRKIALELIRIELLRRTGRFAETEPLLDDLENRVPERSLQSEMLLYQRDLIGQGDIAEHEIPQSDRKPVKP
jgi:hypothetical protein